MLICDECGLVKSFFLHGFIVSAFCWITCAAAQNAPVCGNKIRFGSGHVTSPDAASWTLLKSAVESVVFGWMHFLIFFVVKVSSSVWVKRSICLAENLSRTQRFNLSANIPHLLLQTLWNESIVSISQHLCMKPTACCSILAGRGSLYCIKCWERSVQPRSCRAEVWMSAALVFLWRCSHRYWESSWFSRAAAPH